MSLVVRRELARSGEQGLSESSCIKGLGWLFRIAAKPLRRGALATSHFGEGRPVSTSALNA